MKSKGKSILFLGLFLLFLTMMIIYPKTALKSAEKGLLVCAGIIIPSLFPVNFCVIFIMKIINNLTFKNADINNVFIFFFSLLGGYPTGAKLIDEEYKNGSLDKKTARKMQCYCINGGMGFIISAVGFGVFGSKTIGYLLFLSHSLSSIILCLILNTKKEISKPKPNLKPKSESISDMFVLSCFEATNTIISICSFVILFSVINGFLEGNEFLKYLCFITEITSATKLTNNIYLVSFLLSFGGISIFLQVLSVSKNVGVNIKSLVLSRIFCGIVSVLLLYLTLKVFGISIPVFSNNINILPEIIKTKVSLSVSLIIMIILFIISLEGKNSGGNLGYDLLK